MGFIAYAYQIMAGNDELLHFAPSLDEVHAAAVEQRSELHASGDFTRAELGAMVIYECEMQDLGPKAMMSALNNRDDPTVLLDSCLVSKRIVQVLND